MPEYMEATDIDNSYLSILLQPKHIIIRILWLIAFLVMLGTCLYIVILLIQDYTQYSSYNLVSVAHDSQYVLPAITICNVNLLNKTKMVETKFDDTRSVYDVYSDLQSNFKSRSSESDKYNFEGIDKLDIYSDFAWDIENTLIKELYRFAKDGIDKSTESFRVEYTNMGKCLEINDNSQFVQRIDGQTGGLTIVLDTMTHHYLDTTESEGFYVILRMPNETVLHQEFSFLVSAGQEVHINLETVDVSRLGAPYGSCSNETDYYNKNATEENDVITLKECFLTQLLWLYIRDPQCECFPWYFFERFISNKFSLKYYEGLDEEIVQRFVSGLDEEYRITFNKTCVYDTGYYKGGLLNTTSSISDISSCDTVCRETDNCVVYQYSTQKNDLQDAEECSVYSSETELKTAGTQITGLTRGEVNCTGGSLLKCSVSKGERCGNKIIDDLMAKKAVPPMCHEPCAYQEFRYKLSYSEYPAVNYWNNVLKPIVGHYDTHFDSKLNLVKLVFFTEQMKSISAVQTAAYEIQNFIAEFGGITDLFIGLSFFTVFQLFELGITFCVKRRAKGKKNPNVMEMKPATASI